MHLPLFLPAHPVRVLFRTHTDASIDIHLTRKLRIGNIISLGYCERDDPRLDYVARCTTHYTYIRIKFVVRGGILLWLHRYVAYACVTMPQEIDEAAYRVT